jgi:hypothetical protein
MERGRPNSKIETNLPLHRERLKCAGSVGSSDQNIGAKPGTNRRAFRGRPKGRPQFVLHTVRE